MSSSNLEILLKAEAQAEQILADASARRAALLQRAASEAADEVAAFEREQQATFERCSAESTARARAGAQELAAATATRIAALSALEARLPPAVDLVYQAVVGDL